MDRLAATPVKKQVENITQIGISQYILNLVLHDFLALSGVKFPQRRS